MSRAIYENRIEKEEVVEIGVAGRIGEDREDGRESKE